MQLACLPRSDLAAWTPTLRRLRLGRGVPHDDAALDGVGERLVQDHVDLEDGLRVEATAAIGSAIREQVGVERIEVVSADAPER
jgi:hypothetical protein